jgi:chemotaxis protein methyltransferase CheR
MLIDEFFGKDKPLWDTKILATDISNQILEKAKKAVYNNKDLAQLPPSWKLNYFNKLDANVSTVNDQLKKEIIFRSFNLMTPTFSFKKKFHVIFCRNVMIYFNSETRDGLVDKFYELTEPGGYLFIGHSETLNRERTKYKFVMPAVYRKE